MLKFNLVNMDVLVVTNGFWLNAAKPQINVKEIWDESLHVHDESCVLVGVGGRYINTPDTISSNKLILPNLE